MTDVVSISNLEVSFATDGGDVVAVDDVSFSVAAGAIVAALRRDEGHLRIEGLPELTRALRAART